MLGELAPLTLQVIGALVSGVILVLLGASTVYARRIHRAVVYVERNVAGLVEIAALKTQLEHLAQSTEARFDSLEARLDMLVRFVQGAGHDAT